MRDIITKLEELNVEQEQLNEGLADMAHEAEKDHEVQMARSDCYKSAKYAVAIHKMLKDVSEMEGIDGWVAAKITKAADYLGSVKHYMEGQAMSDVELAVVPVAGDMTDAMTVPQESIAEGRLGFKDIAKFGSAMASKIDMEARRRGSADMEPGDADELRYRIAKEMGLVEGVEVVEAEERTYIVVHAKHGKEEIKASSSYGAAKKYAEMKKLKSTAGVDAHLADEEKTATENIEEGRNDGPMSECCDAPLDGFENGLGRCSDCGEMAGAWNADELDEDEDVIGNIIKNLPKDKHSGSKQADVIGDIIAKLPKDSDEKTVNMPSLPKSKPERTPTVSAVAQQAAANKAVRSMAQDTTRPLTQSKFSEWSKK
jgi:hypothetical protein